ncbi:MAG: universal stress protein [SAR324 cluster bacterium]|nr:universal stress protein [SAR324 cluster bacterium]
MGTTIKKILFTTDLSDHAREVFKQAIRLAGSCQASITMLHVIEETTTNAKNLVIDMMGQEVYEKITIENEAFAQNMMLGKRKEAPIIQKTLEKLAQQSGSMGDGKIVQVDNTLVTVGTVAEEIIQQAEKNGCDIIVMGYHVKNIIAELMLGGKTRRVIRLSKIPVYLVPISD